MTGPAGRPMHHGAGLGGYGAGECDRCYAEITDYRTQAVKTRRGRWICRACASGQDE